MAASAVEADEEDTVIAVGLVTVAVVEEVVIEEDMVEDVEVMEVVETAEVSVVEEAIEEDTEIVVEEVVAAVAQLSGNKYCVTLDSLLFKLMFCLFWLV